MVQNHIRNSLETKTWTKLLLEIFEYFTEVFKIEEKRSLRASIWGQFNEFLAEKIYNQKDKEDLCIILQNWGKQYEKTEWFLLQSVEKTMWNLTSRLVHEMYDIEVAVVIPALFVS